MCKIDCKPKIQSFQYSIIHQYFPCNLYLSKWREDVLSKCNFCDNIDTLIHYFTECKVVTTFWIQLEHWLNNTLDLDEKITLDGCDIMLGKLDQKDYINVINFVIIQAKWYIYCKKLNSNNIVFNEFIRKLMYRLNIEKHRYHLKDDIESFYEIFDCIYDKQNRPNT